MGSRRLQYGDQQSADVELFLKSDCEGGAEFEGNPILLHSEILIKSEYFKASLSGSWSENPGPNQGRHQREVRTKHNFENYINFLRLMYPFAYGDRIRFSNVEECLEILRLALELVVEEYKNECLRYLEAVPWSAEEQLAITDEINALLLENASPDLSARLSNPDDHSKYLEISESAIRKSLLYICKGKNYHDDFVSALDNLLQRNQSPEIAEMCVRVLLEVYDTQIHNIVSQVFTKHACYALLWLMERIRNIDGSKLESVLNKLCVLNLLSETINVIFQPTNINTLEHREMCADLLRLLIHRLLKEMVNGNLSRISTASKAAFLKTWVSTLVRLLCRGNDLLNHDAFQQFESDANEGIYQVMDTLPFDDQILIFNIWLDANIDHGLDFAVPLKWLLQKLGDHYK